MKTWKCYNHALISATPPDVVPDLTELNNKEIWNENGNKALLARWTTDFDCGYETNWWYIIKEAPFDVETLSSRSKKHIRQSLKKVRCEKIDANAYSEELCRVHNNACQGYATYIGRLADVQNFIGLNDNMDCWGVFSLEEERLIGYMTCKRNEYYVETITAKYDPAYLNLRGSDAVHYAVCDYYLNKCKYRYICSGSRNINHITNAQEYKIETFGFRKAYCRLHIEYNPKIKWIIKVLFPLRGFLKLFDGIGFVHQINGVLKMEEIVREQRKINE